MNLKRTYKTINLDKRMVKVEKHIIRRLFFLVRNKVKRLYKPLIVSRPFRVVGRSGYK